MSIIESAITKSRSRGPDPASPPGLVHATAHATTAGGVEGARPFFDTLGSRVIQLDMQALRARGLLAEGQASEVAEEQFRRVKRSLLDHAIGRMAPETPRGRLIMLASSLSGEGKTFCSLNLALSVAKEVDLDVLLVDADVRKADLTRAFGMEAAAGLVEWTANPSVSLEKVALRTSVPRLSFLPSGQMVDGIPELWAGLRMEELSRKLSALSERTVVIVDSSPILQTNEAQVLSRHAGQVLLVVRADSTLQAVVAEAISLIDPDRRIVCLLNCTHERNPGNYKYGYPYVPRGGASGESKP